MGNNLVRSNKKNKLFDLAIIGGGINGAGIALDAALRGLSVVLLEKDDFGSHTTSASTKLIHGGLRYLEYFDFGLVRESLRERERLLRNAPHLAWPLKLNVPVYRHSRRGPALIKAGMILYDILSYDKSLPSHNFYWVGNNGHRLPLDSGINKQGLRAVASYYDCQIGYPERLCIEVVLSAQREGALTLNYHEVLSVSDHTDRKTLLIHDKIRDSRLEIAARMVVNAGGIFVDEVNKRIDKSIPRKMGGTKGSHILIRKFNQGPQNAYYVEAVQDGRPFFVIPWRDYYLIGTTDIYYDGDLDHIIASEKEIDYLLTELHHLFPSWSVTKKDIVYTYSGVRPLPYEPGKKESQITRNHIILDHGKFGGPDNLISIIGGKLTTYRSLAEECVDLVCRKLGCGTKCLTQSYTLIGGKEFVSYSTDLDNEVREYARRFTLSEKIVKHLILYYGSRFKEILALTEKNPELKQTICKNNSDILAQVVYAIQAEQAKTLEDILLRRTSIGTSFCMGLDCVQNMAPLASEYLGWNEEQMMQAIENYIEYINVNHKNHSKN